MIIDLILDRKDGIPYNAKKFYNDCMEYGEISHEITRAMDVGTEENVINELCKYIDEQDYNPEIKKYIQSVKWLESEKLNPMCETCEKCGNDCHGTTEKVWTGCVYKIPKE